METLIVGAIMITFALAFVFSIEYLFNGSLMTIFIELPVGIAGIMTGVCGVMCADVIKLFLVVIVMSFIILATIKYIYVRYVK